MAQFSLIKLHLSYSAFDLVNLYSYLLCMSLTCITYTSFQINVFVENKDRRSVWMHGMLMLENWKWMIIVHSTQEVTFEKNI